MGVLAGQVLRFDEPELEQPGDERASSGEAIKDVHALVGEALPKVVPEDVVSGAEDEVNNLGRGVDDA
jgi:hypothetical protein